MASERKEITRRDFASQTVTAAAAVAAGTASLGGSRAHAAPSVSSRVLGANDRLVFASVGVRGQGNALKRGFARLPGVEIKTLCESGREPLREPGRGRAARGTSRPSSPDS